MFYMSNEYLSDVPLVPEPILQSQSIESSPVTTSYSGYSLGTYRITHYCGCVSCNGSWAGSPTASGAYPVSGRTVAMANLPFGTKVEINGQIYTVEDRGVPSGCVDIYVDSHSEALNSGMYYAEVRVVGQLTWRKSEVIISPYKVFSMSKGNPVDPQKGKAADPLAVR